MPAENIPPEESIHANTFAINLILSSIKETKSSLEDLRDVVYEGKEPLIIRVAAMEKVANHNSRRLDKIEENYSSFCIEDRKARWHFMLLAVVSILGWLTAIFSSEKNPVMHWLVQFIK